MQHPSSLPTPALGLRFGDRTLPATPIHLDGQRASVAVGQSPWTDRGPTQLHLDWHDGRVTELAVENAVVRQPGALPGRFEPTLVVVERGERGTRDEDRLIETVARDQGLQPVLEGRSHFGHRSRAAMEVSVATDG